MYIHVSIQVRFTPTVHVPVHVYQQTAKNEECVSDNAYLPTIPEFPGIHRKIGFHPGIPEILYNSRRRGREGGVVT